MKPKTLLIMEQVSAINHRATGEQMRTLRLRAGITQEQMAKALGLGAPYLCDLEHGRRNWSEELAAKAALVIRKGDK